MAFFNFPAGESITWVKSTGEEYDDWGNPITKEERVDIHNVAVAPSGTSEGIEDFRNPVVTGFTIYLQPEQIEGIQSDDLMIVRGYETKVQGNPGASMLKNPFTGDVAGSILQVKMWEG